MNTEYISRALCFHGQPMQKIWDDERGAGDLHKCGVPQQLNYSVYMERQKYFTFQDRAKRLKLHQFIARKADDLYDSGLAVSTGVVQDEVRAKSKSYIANLPPYELFVNKNVDKTKRCHYVLEGIKPGDIIYGMVAKASPAISSLFLIIKPLCTAEPLVRYLSDIAIKAHIHPANIGPPPLDKRGKPRGYLTSDIVCCEVLDISVDADRLNLGMEGVLTKNNKVQLGVVTADDLPAYYKKATEITTESFEECLLQSKEFLNPNYDILFEINGINVNDTFTMINSLKHPFPPQEYAKELRQTQASKWAFRSVAEGIEHFKIGNHIEAFQCLNKALNIDPRNVEGLVARGALYANKGSFLKAVEDFEKALSLNSYHVNARKYMGETLVALGRSYEEENRIQDAAKAYKDCLKIIPNHEQARLSFEAIQQRVGVNQFFDTNLCNLTGSTSEVEKHKKKKRDESSDSSSDGSSTDSTDSSDTENRDSACPVKEASLSPLSKRMALHAASLEAAATTSNQQFNQPFYMASYNNNTNANEFKLDDDDTGSRVRKLLQEASKHKKEKSKKSKKKKSKKSKKESRKNKDNASTFLEKINFEEAYKAIGGFTIENKISENLHMYEKTIEEIKKRQEILKESIFRSTAHLSPSSLHHRRSESPPPKAPSMTLMGNAYPSSSSRKSTITSSYVAPPPPSYQIAGTSASAAVAKNDAPKLSFQIKRPVKVDKFGLIRIATPLVQKSVTPELSPRRSSRSRSPSYGRRGRNRHSRSRSRGRERYRERSSRSRSRTRSSSLEYRRHRRSGSRRGRYSRSHSRSRSVRGRGGGRGRSGRSVRRRTPSPFVPRDTPPRRRRSRSVTPNRRDDGSRSPYSGSSGRGARTQYGNRVWKRPGYAPPPKPMAVGKKPTASDGRWLHDKFEEKPDDGPSIEEIDEIINQAQKQRKQEIINRDKNILKKTTARNNF